jgi:hypothetical protein
MKKAAYLASALLGVIWGSNFMGSVGLPTFLNRKASAAAKMTFWRKRFHCSF